MFFNYVLQRSRAHAIANAALFRNGPIAIKAAVYPPATGSVRVYDTSDFSLVADIALSSADGSSFVNDIILTKTKAYITDSFQAQLYSVRKALNGS